MKLADEQWERVAQTGETLESDRDWFEAGIDVLLADRDVALTFVREASAIHGFTYDW